MSEQEETVEFKPWDIVRLKLRTGRYRVYSGGKVFIFACLDADVISHSDIDEVVEVLESA